MTDPRLRRHGDAAEEVLSATEPRAPARSFGMRERPLQPAVYLLASRRNGTLYCGSTGDLIRRIWQHRESAGARFTARYGVRRLVWYELHAEMGGAIRCEHQIKKWNRAWKRRLIERFNPDWSDLYETLL